MELFRREALDGQDRLHGEVVFVPQISWRLLALFFAASLLVAALFLFTADHRPATPVAGRLAVQDGALVASLEMPAADARAVLRGQTLRVSAPGVAGTAAARVGAVIPSGTGTVIIRAIVDGADAPTLRPGMAVRAFVAGRPRPLAAWLYESLRSERP